MNESLWKQQWSDFKKRSVSPCGAHEWSQLTNFSRLRSCTFSIRAVGHCPPYVLIGFLGFDFRNKTLRQDLSRPKTFESWRKNKGYSSRSEAWDHEKKRSLFKLIQNTGTWKADHKLISVDGIPKRKSKASKASRKLFSLLVLILLSEVGLDASRNPCIKHFTSRLTVYALVVVLLAVKLKVLKPVLLLIEPPTLFAWLHKLFVVATPH